MTEQAGELAARSLREARRLAALLRERARGRGARAKLRAAERISRVAGRAEQVCERITKRVAGETITDRLVSMSDPDARPIRTGKLRQPTEFGTVMQVAELCENTRRGARGLILPVATQIGSPNESDLVARTGDRLDELGLRPRALALDGGFAPAPVEQHLPPPERTFIAGRQSAGSKKDQPPTREVPGRPRRPHQPPQTPLPHRLRGPHQPPQAPLRATPQPAEGP